MFYCVALAAFLSMPMKTVNFPGFLQVQLKLAKVMIIFMNVRFFFLNIFIVTYWMVGNNVDQYDVIIASQEKRLIFHSRRPSYNQPLV